MGMGASLSVAGLMNWDNRLFDDMSFPDGFSLNDKVLTIQNLVIECSPLEILYPDWNYMKFAIDAWSAKEKFTWDRRYRVALMQYNPLENYNRTEITTDQHSG